MTGCGHETKIRLAEQALASHRAKVASAHNRDDVRRSIRAAGERLKALKAEHEHCPVVAT